MIDKKCRHCAMIIPGEAKICPHCRKVQGWTLSAKIFAGFLLFVLFNITITNLSKQPPPARQAPSSIAKSEVGASTEVKPVNNTAIHNIPKKDGTYDDRENDLEELCKDWFFYRNKILEYSRAGKTEKAADARESFNQVNAWLSQYKEDDVTAMMSKVEAKK